MFAVPSGTVDTASSWIAKRDSVPVRMMQPGDRRCRDDTAT